MRRGGFLIFGTAAWDAPWLTEQNLAHVLAPRSPTLYVEPPLTPATPLRYGLRPESRAQARQLLSRRLRRAGRVALFQPLVLPPRSHPLSRSISAPLLRRQVARAAARAGLDHPVVVSSHATPGAFDAVPSSCRIYLIKDWIEAGGGLLGRDPDTLARERDEMCAAADIVCVISAALQRTLAERGVESTVLRHGFQSDLAPRYDAVETPAALAGLPRPLIGYAGRIDARLDFEALAAVAERFAAGTVVLVGPVNPRLEPATLEALRARPNVRVLPAVGRELLPSYLTQFDCLLMPYREGEWGRHGSPLKLWDYLYAGAPLVGSGYLVLRDYPPPLVRFATGPRAFATEVGRALEAGDEGRDERRATALANSWEARADELERLVANR